MSTRLHYLDSLRSFCMLFGIFVHGNTFFIERPFSIASDLSNYFRMATFFLISGFLIALVGKRTDTFLLIKRRLIALSVPLAFCLILINPITNWFIFIRHNDYMSFLEFIGGGWRQPAEGPGVWLLHLWFLISLCCYVVIYPVALKIAKSKPIKRFSDYIQKQHPEILLLTLAISTACSVVGMRIIFEFTFKYIVFDSLFFWVVMATIIYLPYFFIGIVLQEYRPLFEKLHRMGWATLGIGIIIIFTEGAIRDLLPGKVQTISVLFSRHFMTGALLPILLTFFHRFLNRQNRFISVMSQSMYTIYLMHFFLIFLIGFLLSPNINTELLLYFFICIVTIASGVVFHKAIVEPFRFFSFLVNGRRA